MLPLVHELLKLVVVDAVFVVLCLLALIPLAKWNRAAFAVLRRNFVGYFSNPTGYVFLCLFVLLTSVAAFCPHEFFSANLANLDQLNQFLPYIMLVFIPAITMSIWAEERRQGTDELLLTLPAGDFDIVIGKFLAAAAIFTASLLFSQISNYVVLIALSLGDLDTGLLMATYLGYWLVGLAMISLGMVASFLTSNLTVGFILGALFNAPLAFAAQADTIASSNLLARAIARWSILARMDDFGRGVLSLSSLAYFAMIVAVGLYLSMVLIGRRNWSGGADGTSMLGHYLFRALSIVVIGAGAVLILTRYDARKDVTEEQISSLSQDTQKLIDTLDTQGRTIYIDAYISAEVPDEYVQTRFNLVSMLKEFQSRAPDKIALSIHDNLEAFSEAAEEAEKNDIYAQRIRTRIRDQIHDRDVIMGAAFRCGLDKVVVPFFDYGIPVEYELIRSISTVARESRKRIGVVRTGANMFGGIGIAGDRPVQLPRRAIIDELLKQYDVREVDPSSAIPTDEYDALMLVQPSSLGPAELDNVMQAIRAGVPTAIFEDPRPHPQYVGNVPATAEQRVPTAQMAMMGEVGAQPKGDIRRLWTLIGIQTPGRPGGPAGFQPDVVWQQFNPYPKLQQLEFVNDSYVFASTQAPGAQDSISTEDKITSRLNEMFFLMPGAIEKQPGSQLKFKKLVSTGPVAGRIKYQDLMDSFGDPMDFRMRQGQPRGEQVLAARITGYLEDDEQAMMAPGPQAEAGASEEGADVELDPELGPRPLDIVYVADIDLMADDFLRLRARPDSTALEVHFRFENVTFLLNIFDVLTGDDSYVEIRKRKPHLSTLQLVEHRVRASREEELAEERKFKEQYDQARREAENERDEQMAELQKEQDRIRARQQAGETVDYAELQALQAKLNLAQAVANGKLQVAINKLQRERSQALDELSDETERSIRRIQNTYKLWSVLLPPIPPLLVGIVVFVRRRLRERESISRDPSRRV